MTETIKVYKDTPIIQVYIDDDAPGVIFIPSGLVLSVINEVPAGLINGSNATYTAAYSFVPETVEIWINGVKQKIVDDYNLSGGLNIILNTSPTTGEHILINYSKT